MSTKLEYKKAKTAYFVKNTRQNHSLHHSQLQIVLLIINVPIQYLMYYFTMMVFNLTLPT